MPSIDRLLTIIALQRLLSRPAACVGDLVFMKWTKQQTRTHLVSHTWRLGEETTEEQ